MHHYPFHVGDYQKDTAHFDQDPEKVEVPVGLVRDLAYRRLLDLYHSQEGPIPNKTHWVATRVRLLAHAAIVGSVLKEFFELRDGFWHQKRADAEVARYLKRVVTNQENGKKGGRKPTTIPNGNPVGSKPRTRTRTNLSPLTPEGAVLFDGFWKLYPRSEGKPAAMKAYAKAMVTGASPEAILLGLQRYVVCDQWQDPTKVPHASTWLNRQGWNDTPPAARVAGAASGNWWESRQGLLDKAIELGIPAPADTPQAFLAFKAAVWVAAGDGPWWDNTDTAYQLAVRLRDGNG